MAQKREKEETELKVSEAITLCSANPSISMSSQPSSPSQLPVGDSRNNFAKPSRSLDPNIPFSDESRSNSIFTRLPERSDLICENDQKKVGDLNRSLKRPRDVSRCSGSNCKKKLGLMGFRCRCGDLFCSEHRYSDRHSCSYDYKSAGREAIARENPVVKAAKILKV